MSTTLLIRRTYKYRLYHNTKANAALCQQINVADMIWSHALALHKHLCNAYTGQDRAGHVRLCNC